MLAYPVWLLRMARWRLRDVMRRRRRASPYVAILLEDPPPEPDAPRPPFWQRFFGRRALSVQTLAAQLRAAAEDPRVQGVVLHLRPVALGHAQVDALRRAMADVRASGTRVTCWASTYTTGTYLVACAGDEVLLQPGGMVAPIGLVSEFVFLADALDRLGVRADMLQVSPYKTAADPLIRRGLTPEAREMAEWLADAILADRVDAVAAGRRIDAGTAAALVGSSPYTDEEALAAGAIDGILVEDDLPARLGGDIRPWSTARRSLPTPRPVRPGQVVALLRVEGTIVDGRSRRAPFRPPMAPPILFDNQCGDLTVVEQARALALDRRVGAVVLWIDSGGGSATASEAMTAAIRALARRKPVVAAMGAVAASGGYYAATGASRILAHPGTITGSIGVLAGKLVTGGLFDRLLLHRDRVVRGDFAAMWSADQPFTDAEREKMAGMIGRSYDLFLERVAAARGRPVEDVIPIAGGRVWTGRQAVERGLVDELGGLAEAIAVARSLGRLRPDAPLREAGHGRRELTRPPATTPAALEHALTAVAALQRAGVWALCPIAGDGTPG